MVLWNSANVFCKEISSLCDRMMPIFLHSNKTIDYIMTAATIVFPSMNYNPCDRTMGVLHPGEWIPRRTNLRLYACSVAPSISPSFAPSTDRLLHRQQHRATVHRRRLPLARLHNRARDQRDYHRAIHRRNPPVIRAQRRRPVLPFHPAALHPNRRQLSPAKKVLAQFPSLLPAPPIELRRARARW